MDRPRRILAALLLGAMIHAPHASALDVDPGTTSSPLQAQGCLSDQGALLGDCLVGCQSNCDLPSNTTESYLDVTGWTIGKKFVETTSYTEFRVTPPESGAEHSLDATVRYDVDWKGGWTLDGIFTGFNDGLATISLTLFDQTAGGAVVRSEVIHTHTPDGFIGIDIVDIGFGVDEGSAANAFTAQVLRGHTYRLGLKVRCEAKGAGNAYVILDYLTGGWGVTWNDLNVSLGPDVIEEIEKLKKRVDALEQHTHTYLTGRGEGHNNTEAETSKPILIVEEPTDDERRVLPKEGEPLPVRSVFLSNAPNPFNPSTTITYTLPEPMMVSIKLYDAQGRLARTLVSADRAAGPHAFAFDGADLASGVYYYRLTAGRFTETRKLTLLK